VEQGGSLHRVPGCLRSNQRGRPLTSYRTIVELAATTTTRTGLKVQAEWDDGVYQKGIKITDKALAALPITRSEWHGEWNYTLAPTDEEHRK
jgi:hypothetical protein